MSWAWLFFCTNSHPTIFHSLLGRRLPKQRDAFYSHVVQHEFYFDEVFHEETTNTEIYRQPLFIIGIFQLLLFIFENCFFLLKHYQFSLIGTDALASLLWIMFSSRFWCISFLADLFFRVFASSFHAINFREKRLVLRTDKRGQVKWHLLFCQVLIFMQHVYELLIMIAGKTFTMMGSAQQEGLYVMAARDMFRYKSGINLKWKCGML